MSITEVWIPITELLSHPAYREWLYVFVPVRTRRCRRRRRRPQTFVHAITSEQLFRFLSCLEGLMTFTCRLDYLIRYGRFWSAITQPHMVWWPRKEKQKYCLYSRPLNVTMRFDLGHGLDLKFSRSNMKFAIPQVLNQIYSNCHEIKSKRLDWI